jgi:hypothetical protein
MTFAMQVRHFVRFDLARTSTWWIAYLVLLAITPLVMFGQPLYGRLPDMSRIYLPLLTWCVALGLTVTVVQSDAPLSPTAFWKGKPIDERALRMAKLVMVGLVVFAASVVAVIAWRASGMPWALIVPTLRQAVPAYFIPLLFTTLFGAVTRRWATALLLSMGFLLCTLLTLPVAMIAGGDPTMGIGFYSRFWPNLLKSVLFWAVVALALTYPLRRTRGLRSAMLVVATLLLGAVVTVSQLFVQLRRMERSSVSYLDRTLIRVTADAPASMPETVRFDSLARLQRVGRSEPFTVVGARRDRRYELQQVRLTPFDGRGIGGRMISLSATSVAVPPNALDIDSTFAWTRGPALATEPTAGRGTIFGGWRVGQELDTVRTIALEGTLVRYRAERVTVLPFAYGLVYADSSASIYLTADVSGMPALTWASFRDAGTRRDVPGGLSSLYRQFAFVVVDSVQQTARLLGAASEQAATEWMVLPGAVRWVNTNQLDYQPALRALLERRGRRAASMIVYQWVEDGRRRIRQTERVNDWPRIRGGPPSLGAAISYGRAR